MPDLLLDLGAKPWYRQAVKGLGLPLPLPQKLDRAAGPWVERPLAGKRAVVLRGGLGDLVGDILDRAGAKVQNDEGHAPANQTHTLVFDATDFRTVDDLRALHDFFRRWIPSIDRCGRVLVVGRDPASAPGPVESAVSTALDGFVRSLAKELGRKGATAHLVYVTRKSEARLEPVMRFLCSTHSSFLSGQPWHLSTAAKASKKDVSSVRPLEDKVALVTGAARGIGAATVKALAAEGASVVCVDRPEDEEVAWKVARPLGGKVLAFDVTAESTPTKLAEALEIEFGGVDIIVHNAGITRDKTLAKMSEDQWDAVMAVNLTAILRLDEVLVPKVLRDRGRIVCMSSVAGIAGNVGQTNYATSKSGVIGYVRAQSAALAGRGITVNAVAPGFIETRLTDAIPKMTREVARRFSALGQGGQPRDVADLVVFLATPGASGLTGQVLRACGGMFVGA